MTSAEREEFILRNMGLVGSCAAKLRGRGAEYEELYQAGCAGLIRAADSFDPSLGYRFSSYAVPHILGEMRSVLRSAGGVHVSRSVLQLAAKARAVSEQLGCGAQQPGLSEIAQRCGCSVQQLAFALSAAGSTVSLDARLEAGHEPAAADDEEKRLMQIILKNCISALAKEDRLLLYYRCLKGMSQSETAKLLGVSQSYISRNERRLLNGLREQLLAE